MRFRYINFMHVSVVPAAVLLLGGCASHEDKSVVAKKGASPRIRATRRRAGHPRGRTTGGGLTTEYVPAADPLPIMINAGGVDDDSSVVVVDDDDDEEDVVEVVSHEHVDEPTEASGDDDGEHGGSGQAPAVPTSPVIAPPPQTMPGAGTRPGGTPPVGTGGQAVTGGGPPAATTLAGAPPDGAGGDADANGGGPSLTGAATGSGSQPDGAGGQAVTGGGSPTPATTLAGAPPDGAGGDAGSNRRDPGAPGATAVTGTPGGPPAATIRVVDLTGGVGPNPVDNGLRLSGSGASTGTGTHPDVAGSQVGTGAGPASAATDGAGPSDSTGGGSQSTDDASSDGEDTLTGSGAADNDDGSTDTDAGGHEQGDTGAATGTGTAGAPRTATLPVVASPGEFGANPDANMGHPVAVGAATPTGITGDQPGAIIPVMAGAGANPVGNGGVPSGSGAATVTGTQLGGPDGQTGTGAGSAPLATNPAVVITNDSESSDSTGDVSQSTDDASSDGENTPTGSGAADDGDGSIDTHSAGREQGGDTGGDGVSESPAGGRANTDAVDTAGVGIGGRASPVAHADHVVVPVFAVPQPPLASAVYGGETGVGFPPHITVVHPEAEAGVGVDAGITGPLVDEVVPLGDAADVTGDDHDSGSPISASTDGGGIGAGPATSDAGRSDEGPVDGVGVALDVSNHVPSQLIGGANRGPGGPPPPPPRTPSSRVAASHIPVDSPPVGVTEDGGETNSDQVTPTGGHQPPTSLDTHPVGNGDQSNTMGEGDQDDEAPDDDIPSVSHGSDDDDDHDDSGFYLSDYDDDDHDDDDDGSSEEVDVDTDVEESDSLSTVSLHGGYAAPPPSPLAAEPVATTATQGEMHGIPESSTAAAQSSVEVDDGREESGADSDGVSSDARVPSPDVPGEAQDVPPPGGDEGGADGDTDSTGDVDDSDSGGAVASHDGVTATGDTPPGSSTNGVAETGGHAAGDVASHPPAASSGWFWGPAAPLAPVATEVTVVDSPTPSRSVTPVLDSTGGGVVGGGMDAATTAVEGEVDRRPETAAVRSTGVDEDGLSDADREELLRRPVFAVSVPPLDQSARLELVTAESGHSLGGGGEGGSASTNHSPSGHASAGHDLDETDSSNGAVNDDGEAITGSGDGGSPPMSATSSGTAESAGSQDGNSDAAPSPGVTGDSGHAAESVASQSAAAGPAVAPASPDAAEVSVVGSPLPAPPATPTGDSPEDGIGGGGDPLAGVVASGEIPAGGSRPVTSPQLDHQPQPDSTASADAGGDNNDDEEGEDLDTFHSAEEFELGESHGGTGTGPRSDPGRSPRPPAGTPGGGADGEGDMAAETSAAASVTGGGTVGQSGEAPAASSSPRAIVDTPNAAEQQAADSLVGNGSGETPAAPLGNVSLFRRVAMRLADWITPVQLPGVDSRFGLHPLYTQ